MHRADNHADSRIHGTVTAFTSPQAFEVNGLKVDAAQARFDLHARAIELGTHVHVKGSIVDGVLVATEVKVDGRGDDSMREVELHGMVSGLDTQARRFVVREVTVDYSGPIDWHDGAEANLRDGSRVEVKGVWSDDHRTLKATRIEFEG
jgi:hypothetical protein